MRKTWQPLKKNDKVRIIAPGAASPVTQQASSSWDDLEACCAFLRHWELEPVYSPHIFGEYKSYYNFSNTDQARSADFIDAVQSDAAAIWTFRGGYGSDRITNTAIKQQIQPKNPKLFVGFSDVTSLHSYLNTHWQWQTLHALSLRQLGLLLVDDADIEKTRQIIFGETNQVTLALKPLNAIAAIQKDIQATLSGGNLSIIQAALGTSWQIPTDKTILLCEDVGEAPYRIARIFQQFLANGLLDTLQAVILGDFIPDKNMDLVLHEFAEQCPVPVLQYQGIGHGRQNQPIPLGAATELRLGLAPELVVSIREN